MQKSKKNIVSLYWELDQQTTVSKPMWDCIYNIFKLYNLFKIDIYIET